MTYYLKYTLEYSNTFIELGIEHKIQNSSSHIKCVDPFGQSLQGSMAAVSVSKKAGKRCDTYQSLVVPAGEHCRSETTIDR